ncbi:baseplate J/gp47 family protein [Sphingomonas sp.]|uniref:baseplate assembly protein n=1 Tax=Sphingomonas sp. TaxID=28214 RepID=UPI000DBC2E89|nr:baseplate J/gp47 family protein [Sphingomonas sp.]PZT91664.1 MAG: baseplate assembly protein [Sphingomonas sp.]
MDLAAASTPVDLSRLPAPVLIAQPGFDTIVATLVAAMKEQYPDFDATLDSEPIMMLLQAAAYQIMLIRADFNDSARQLLLAFATGARLDHLGALVGLPRLVLAPADPVTGTTAVMEGDEAFRQRIVLAPESFSVAGPDLAYVAFARRADGDVADASVTNPAPGEVVVTVLSAQGDGTAPAALLAKVRAQVDDRAVRPLTDAVTVQSATILPFAVDARVWTFSGPDAALILSAGRAALDRYIVESRKLGRAIRRSGIEGALQVAGVERVELPGWVDIVPDRTKAAHCTGIQVTHAGYA